MFWRENDRRDGDRDAPDPVAVNVPGDLLAASGGVPGMAGGLVSLCGRLQLHLHLGRAAAIFAPVVAMTGFRWRGRGNNEGEGR